MIADELRKKTRIQSSTKPAMGFLFCLVYPSHLVLSILDSMVVQNEEVHTRSKQKAAQEKSYSSGQRSKKGDSYRSEKVKKILFFKSSFYSFPLHTLAKPAVAGMATAVVAGQASKIRRKETLLSDHRSYGPKSTG